MIALKTHIRPDRPNDDENENYHNNTLSKITGEVHDDNDTHTDTDTEVIFLEECLHLLEDDAVVSVICGVEGETCKSLDVLLRESSKGREKIKKSIPL